MSAAKLSSGQILLVLYYYKMDTTHNDDKIRTLTYIDKKIKVIYLKVHFSLSLDVKILTKTNIALNFYVNLFLQSNLIYDFN